MAGGEPSREAVETALADLLTWPGLARSPQLSRFLNHIVQAKLRGDEGSIKAYSIAVDVFGRPPTFDPQSDPIVRVQAGRLRAALAEYYRGEGGASNVRIYLPVGRYVPEFLPGSDRPVGNLAESAAAISPAIDVTGPEKAAPARPSRLGEALLVVAVAAVALIIVLVLGQVLQPRPVRLIVPERPSVAVSEFTALAEDETGRRSVAGLAIELVTDLQLFSTISAEYLQGSSDNPGESGRAAYQLTGIARAESGSTRVTASLRRSGSDPALWTRTLELKDDSAEQNVDETSRAFAEQLGSLRGPLHQDGLRWLELHPDLAGSETEYLCELLFGLYRDSGRVDDAARARDCVSSLLQREAGSATLLAIGGALLVDDMRAVQAPGSFDPEPMQEAARLFERSLAAGATSSFVWELYAHMLEIWGRHAEADAAYASAVQLNPANLDALAGYARFLVLAGPSTKGLSFARHATENALDPPAWYFAAPAVDALRNGEDYSAIAYGEQLAATDSELGAVIATVAAHRLDARDVLNRSLAQMLEVTRFRRFGILPVLHQRIPDVALVEQIGKELAAAGVTPAALGGRY